MNREHWSQSVAGRLVSQAEFIGSTLEKVQSNTWLLLLPTPMEPTGALIESLEPMCRVFANATGKSKILIPPNPILHVIHFYSCLISLEPKLPVHLISSSWLKETLLLLVLPFKGQAKEPIKRSSLLMPAFYCPTPSCAPFLFCFPIPSCAAI